MAFEVTFGSQGSFNVGFPNEAQMRVEFRRNTEFNANTENPESFNSEFEGGTQMSAAFLNGSGAKLPAGGDTGDLLAKKSEEDGDAEWITPAQDVEIENFKPVTSHGVYVSVNETKEELLAIIEELREELAQTSKMWFGTRVEYNSLEWIDPEVCYCIEEGT